MLGHTLNGLRARYAWLWPLPLDPAKLILDLQAHGVTGVVPQQSDVAVAWARRWAPTLRRVGLDVCVGLGRVSAKAILDALDVPDVTGVMLDQEDWRSVPDSEAVVAEVLRRRPDAPARVADCFYPCVEATEGGTRTGHGPVTRAWAPLCGLRAPQCYFEGGVAPDGWVAARLAFARREYAAHGNEPTDPVRGSVQLYRHRRASLRDLLLAEGETGSIFLWDWRERDPDAVTALSDVVALERAGCHGRSAVRDFQRAHGLVADGALGPVTARALADATS